MIHKNFINLCLTLLAVCWSVAVQAQTLSVDGIDYSLNKSDMTATVTGPNTFSGHLVIPEKVVYEGEEYKVTRIDNEAFKNCSSLTSVSMPSVTYIDGAAFSGCSNLASVDMPSVTSVTIWAFSNCSSLASVDMPLVTTIGREAFFYCSSLASVNMPLATAIDYAAFKGCSSLASIEIPSSVTSINGEVFSNCSSLVSVEIPLSVTSIGTYAFSSCSSLASVEILSSVTSIGYGAFSGCSSLASVEIPSSVTSINGHVFSDCSSLTSVKIPSSVTSIDSEAFSGCSNLASVEIPSSVTRINEATFENCPIYKLNLSKNLKFIGNNNFAKVRQINIDATVPPTIKEQSFGEHVVFLVPGSAVETYKTAAVWSNYKGRIISTSDANFDVTATAQEKESGLLNEIKEENLNKVVTLKVSGTINGYDIMVMRNKMPNLRNIDLTNATIVANGYNYYQGSHTEDNVIGGDMFRELDNLISLKLPDNAVTISDYAIYGCSALEEVALPGKLEAIRRFAFYGCSNLKNIVFPPLLKSIGDYAFYGCSRLSNIDFPPLLKYIYWNAFCSCKNLTSVSLAGVEIIYSSAFSGCNKLSEVRLPSTLKSISNNAFSSISLKRIYAYTVEPVNIDQTAFDKSAYKSATLYIPLQARDNYYWNTQWSQFAELREFDEPYKYFYLNKEFTLNDRFTGEPDIDINPGGGIIVPDEPGKGDQDADDIHIKGDGKNWASIIANANLNAKGLYIDITIKANRWYFFSFPFKVKKKNIMCGKDVKFIFRHYNGAIRASQGKGGWVDLDDAEEYLYPGKGYIFQASLDCTLSIKIEKSDFGKLPKLDIDTKLDIHASANEQDASWNFVGNPFTAFYDINAMGYNSPITRWNSESNTYEAVRPGDDNAFLNPFEAFFVQCPNDNNEINFSGDNRLTQTGKDKKKNENQQKAKAMATFDVKRQIINLTLSDGTTTDRTRVVFNPDRMAKYEKDCDAAKFEGSDAAEIYTVEAQAGRLAINERQEGCVQIGYRAVKGGDHTIAAQRMDRPVLLRDNALQITFDLTQGDYHFHSAAGQFDNRFMLLIDNSATGIGDIVSSTGVNVKPTDDGLNISNLNGKTVHVYGANGALYATRTQEGYLTLPKGVYVVEVDGMKAKFMVR